LLSRRKATSILDAISKTTDRGAACRGGTEEKAIMRNATGKSPTSTAVIKAAKIPRADLRCSVHDLRQKKRASLAPT
jgi:hypothetical protein